MNALCDRYKRNTSPRLFNLSQGTITRSHSYSYIKVSVLLFCVSVFCLFLLCNFCMSLYFMCFYCTNFSCLSCYSAYFVTLTLCLNTLHRGIRNFYNNSYFPFHYVLSVLFLWEENRGSGRATLFPEGWTAVWPTPVITRNIK